jgi:TFIIF-interacting CTD phosphatase-like protein
MNTHLNHEQTSTPLPKLNVVLDLDETLVHASIAGPSGQSEQSAISQYGTDPNEARTADCIDIRLHTEKEELVHVNRRPGLDAFLQAASQEFNLFAFTASESFYAHPLLDALDPKKKYFGDRRLSRNACTLIGDGRYTKDLCQIALSEMNADHQSDEGKHQKKTTVDDTWFQRTVLVDNNPFSFVPQPKNGIPVVSWYSNPEDVALNKVYMFLEQLVPLKDVRPHLDATFHVEQTLNKFAQANGPQVFQPVDTNQSFGRR